MLLQMLPVVMLAAAEGPAQRIPTFSAESRMVNLTVSVTDNRGRFLPDLSTEDFSVYEDGVLRPILSFSTEKAYLHLDLVIIMDASASMRNYFTQVGEAARQLVASLPDDDHVEVLTFAGGVYRACPFTSDRSVINAALAFRGSEDGGSRVFRALTDAFRELRAHDEDRERRKAIVIFTDGLDNDPFADDEWLLREASAADASVYVLLRPVPISDDDPGDYRNPRTVLTRLARETGGASFPMGSSFALQLAFKRIGTEFRTQYRIGYEPSDRRPAGRWRTINLHVRGGGKPKHKLRYFVPASR